MKSPKKLAFLLAVAIFPLALSLPAFLSSGSASPVMAEPDPHDHTGMTEWTSTNSLPTVAGSYYLASNVTITSSWVAPTGETTLCLNGHTITGSGVANVIKVTAASSILTIEDHDNTGVITGGHGYNIYGAGVYVNSATFNLRGGTISGNSSSGNMCGGGGVEMEGTGGTFNMYGGVISGNSSAYGGGVYARGTTFNMYGGEISGNTATQTDGGAIHAHGGTAVINMYGGTLSNNTATCGGGIEKEIQPSDIKAGTVLSVTMDLPEGIDANAFRLLHIHSAEDTEFINEFKVDGGKVTFNLSRFSQIAIVTKVPATNGWGIALLIIASLALAAGVVFLILLLKKMKQDGDDNGQNNKKEPVKAMSFAGLPIVVLAGGLAPIFIIAIIIAALAVAVWAVDIVFFVRLRKKQNPTQKVESAPENLEEKAEPLPMRVEEKAEPTQEAVAVAENDEEDGGELETVSDEKGNVFQIRYVRSFTAKLIQAPEETKKYYEELKNEVLSYKKANSRISWHFDSVNSGRVQVLKFAIRGKTLCVYLALNADDYNDTKYKVEKAESKKFEDVPCLYRIKNDRRLGYAKDLIAVIMGRLGVEKGEEKHESYADLPYEPNRPLIERGLIKELKVAVNKPQEAVAVAENDEEDGGELETVTDEKGNVFQIRYVRSFTAKLIQAPKETKQYYEELKNEVLSYKKANSRISWHYDAINVGREKAIKFAIRGKTLCVYFALNAEDYAETKYKVEAVESKKFEETPCLYRIKNDRRLGYAKDLIAVIMARLGVIKGEEKHESYADLPYEPNKPLIERGLIKELKVAVNKPQEAVATKKTNADGDEVILTKDGAGNLFEIRFVKSFTAKLSQSEDVVKNYYSILKNYALSYKNVHTRVSWHFDSLNLGRAQILKFAIRGKTLCVYFALNAEDYADTKYKVEKVESKKFEDVPCLYRIKNDRRLGYAKDLIDALMTKFGTVKGKESNEDFTIPYETTEALLEKGLVKELKTKVNAKEEEPLHSVEASTVDSLMSDEKAESSIEEDAIHSRREGKKGIINIDTLSENFNDGDTVDLDALIEKKLVPANTGYVKVLARGVLDKKLIVELDDFSLQAVKMIVLMGGHAKKIK